MCAHKEPPRTYLLSIPRLPQPPNQPLLAGALFPFVLVVMGVILLPRLLLVALLLILRLLKVLVYNLWPPVGLAADAVSRWSPPTRQLVGYPLLAVLALLVLPAVVLRLPALAVFAILSLVQLPFMVLLQFNLALSGMTEEDQTAYVSLVLGPVIGTRDAWC